MFLYLCCLNKSIDKKEPEFKTKSASFSTHLNTSNGQFKDSSKLGITLHQIIINHEMVNEFKFFAKRYYCEESILFLERFYSIKILSAQDCQDLLNDFFVPNAIHWINLSYKTHVIMMEEFGKGNYATMFKCVIVEVTSDLKFGDIFRLFCESNIKAQQLIGELDGLMLNEWLTMKNMSDLQKKLNIEDCELSKHKIYLCCLIHDFLTYENTSMFDLIISHPLTIEFVRKGIAENQSGSSLSNFSHQSNLSQFNNDKKTLFNFRFEMIQELTLMDEIMFECRLFYGERDKSHPSKITLA